MSQRNPYTRNSINWRCPATVNNTKSPLQGLDQSCDASDPIDGSGTTPIQLVIGELETCAEIFKSD